MCIHTLLLKFRFFWVLSLIISLALTSQLTFKFFKNISKNSIVIHVEEKNVNVADLNFPALTFCPGLIIAETQATYYSPDEVGTGDDRVIIDYDKIVEGLKNRKMSIDDLTDQQ